MAVTWLSTIAATLIGVFAWREWWLVALTFFIPILVGFQKYRRCAAAVALAYYGAASWPLIQTYRAFAGEPAASIPALLIWLVASSVLAVPMGLAWTANRTALAWRMPLALAITVTPPLGIIGWGSPIVSAGVLFPGTAWFGLGAAILLPGLLIVTRPLIWTIVLISTVAAQFCVERTPPPQNWRTVETAFSTDQDFQASESIQRSILNSKAAVTVFPESVISRWTTATEAFWEPTLARLASQSRVAIIGAGLSIAESSAYDNVALVITGARSRAFLQRIPVPLGMWRPFGSGPTVPLRLTRPGTIDIAGERVAFLICYEQLLVWPFLQSAAEQPTLIVGMANQHWIRNTNIPAAQRACLKAWSRLFALPLLIAENK
jgi:hypothetical protein